MSHHPSAHPAIPHRPIDDRFLPPVAGVDLVQSLNYLALDDLGADFLYNNYTAGRLAYVAGSRPGLEAIALPRRGATPIETVQTLATYVAEQVPWAGYYHKKTGLPLPPDRALSEEDIDASGFGWCNEQARLLCGLTQVVGLPSRLVFGANFAKRYGHVVTEVLLPEGWLMVDESFGLLFLRDGQPVRAADVYRDPAQRAYFSPIYKGHCDALIADLGRPILSTSFAMCLGPDPLDGFLDLGYHNHFVV